MKYVIIGAGISGLSMAHVLMQKNHQVVVLEGEDRPGGLIKCDIVEGSLFHCTGGHVFNTKRADVFEWFWSYFDKEHEFTKALRNSSVIMDDGSNIPYPIENHVYLLNKELQYSFIKDLLSISKRGIQHSSNFEDFLRSRFGETLYNLYFQPYNYKVWRRDLNQVPISWLEGKLPMPTVEEMIYNNMNHVEERTFVHSSFYYPVQGGSQFIANRMAQGIDVRYGQYVDALKWDGVHWVVNGIDADGIIFCGNIKQLPSLLKGDGVDCCEQQISQLEYHGTTSVFCEIDINDYSWIYQPSRQHESHRIICTGNFSVFNNARDKFTGTVEFTDFISKEDILENLKQIPYNPHYLAHHYEKYTYPIQNRDTRDMISTLKEKLKKRNFYLLGRFAEWEYYNMDVAMGAAIDLGKTL